MADRYNRSEYTYGPCEKRTYKSRKAARFAVRRAGNRLRTYKCDVCRGWHVTDSEKK